MRSQSYIEEVPKKPHKDWAITQRNSMSQLCSEGCFDSAKAARLGCAYKTGRGLLLKFDF